MPSKKGSKRSPLPIIMTYVPPATRKKLIEFTKETDELREYPFLHSRDLPLTKPTSDAAIRAAKRNISARNPYARWDITHSQIRKLTNKKLPSKTGGKRRKHKKTVKKSCSWW